MRGDREDGGAVTLVVAFDGAFWSATVERVFAGRAEAARHVFGAEPSAAEVLQFVRGPGWSRLRFVPLDAGEGRAADGDAGVDGNPGWAAEVLRANPKRRMRETARAMRDPRLSTRAHEATRRGYEEQARDARADGRAEREAAEAEKRAKEILRRKAKHRGR